MTNPIAFFITWTVYGTHLPGSEKWWSSRDKRGLTPMPKLEQWCQDRLSYPVITLGGGEREVVEATIVRHCELRGWKLWKTNPRSTHVHVVVGAIDGKAGMVRDQLKAYCTRNLRSAFPRWNNRPIWTEGGDCTFVYTQEDLESVIEYVANGQDVHYPHG